MSRRPRQSDPQSVPSRYPSALSLPQKRHLNPSSPTQYQHPELASDGFPRASSSRRSLHATSISFDNPLVDRRPLKPPNPSATVTSPGWDPIGDDDEIYIQSDDTHLRDLASGSHRSSIHTRNPRLDQSLMHLRKRKRSPQPASHQSSRCSKPSSSSNPSRAPLKYDDEGCSNCRTKQSSCWWKKSKSIILSDGTEAWGEEKLCNPCSIHWNKNGFHRHVRPKVPKEPMQPRVPDIPARSSSSRPRRSCATVFSAGPSSPTASITKTHTTLPRRTRHSRSPSQLNPAAEREEREARIVQRSLAKACAKSEALRQKQKYTKISYISEEDEHFDNLPPSLPPAPPRSSLKHSTRKTSRSINQVTNLPSVDIPSPESFLLDLPNHATPDLDLSQYPLNHTKTQYPVDPALASFPANQHTPDEFFRGTEQPLFENISLSPPRTPPPNSHINAGKQVARDENSPGHLFDIDNILSPSFLNASPNSLLRRLNSHKTIADTSGGTFHLSAMCLSNFPPGVSEKVFSPHRPLASNSPPNPTQPMAEPIKKPDLSPNPRLIGSAGLLDAHMNSECTNWSKKSIFSPPRPASKTRESASRKSKSKSIAISSESADQVFGLSKIRRTKKDTLDEFLNGTKISLDRSISNLQPAGSSKRASDSSRKQSHVQSIMRPQQTHTKQHMARTIWSRRFESAGLSSEDSHLEEMFTKKMASRPPSETHPSEPNSTSAPYERTLLQTGLSSAVYKGLNPTFSTDGRLPNRFGGGIGYSDGGNNVVSASSPPVLPPPSDCSEGITPQSDDGEKEPKKPNTTMSSKTSTFANTFPAAGPKSLGQTGIHQLDYDFPVEASHEWSNGPLSDITPSLNHRSRHHTDSSRLALNPNSNQPQDSHHDDGLSPEIMSALNEAIKAGLSADELARALRTLDPTGPPNTTTTTATVPTTIPNTTTTTTTTTTTINNHQDNNDETIRNDGYPLNPLMTNDSFLDNLSDHHLFQTGFDNDPFFLPPDPLINPITTHTSLSNAFETGIHSDLPPFFPDNHLGSSFNIDPTLVSDIDSILNHHHHI